MIWSGFAAAESHNGLFHAVADPIYSWGVVRKVTFPGVNMDIGHVRNITWAKDNDEKKWVAYNRLRGQYMSALGHAVPERFFNDDPKQCNLQRAATHGRPAGRFAMRWQPSGWQRLLTISSTTWKLLFSNDQSLAANKENYVS